jgi:hypothetical protein
MAPDETDSPADEEESESGGEEEEQEDDEGGENGDNGGDEEIENQNTVLQLRGSRSRLSSYLKFPLDRLGK